MRIEEHERYVQTSLAILKSDKLTFADKVIYQIAKSYAHSGNGTFTNDAQIDRIAQESGASSRQVKATMKKLIALGLTSRERDEKKRGRPWVYRFHDLSAEFTGDKPVRLPENLPRENGQDTTEEQPGQAPNQLEHKAFEIFEEVTGYPVSKRVKGLREAIAETVTDLDRWRRVLEYCVSKEFATNTLRIVDAYNEGWGIKKAKPHPQEAATSGGVFIINDEWKRQLRKRGLIRDEGVSSGTAPMITPARQRELERIARLASVDDDEESPQETQPLREEAKQQQQPFKPGAGAAMLKRRNPDAPTSEFQRQTSGLN